MYSTQPPRSRVDHESGGAILFVIFAFRPDFNRQPRSSKVGGRYVSFQLKVTFYWSVHDLRIVHGQRKISHIFWGWEDFDVFDNFAFA